VTKKKKLGYPLPAIRVVIMVKRGTRETKVTKDPVDVLDRQALRELQGHKDSEDLRDPKEF
jgi:hypothetical protein